MSSISDINECISTPGGLLLHDCSLLAVCENLMGTFNCTCDKGYIGDGRICEGHSSYDFEHIFYYWTT